MTRSDEIRIPAAVLGAALAAVLGAAAMYLAMRRRHDAQRLDALTRRSGSDERRRGCHATDEAGMTQELPVENQAIEPAPGVRVSVIG
ncbi:MAG: hypothetical protein ACK515_00815 [bacterium]|jgi:hypothetical protein|nr:hypothetical protein [Betaproteobacteria bacterium]